MSYLNEIFEGWISETAALYADEFAPVDEYWVDREWEWAGAYDYCEIWLNKYAQYCLTHF